VSTVSEYRKLGLDFCLLRTESRVNMLGLGLFTLLRVIIRLEVD
jgi:hypothetical protein